MGQTMNVLSSSLQSTLVRSFYRRGSMAYDVSNFLDNDDVDYRKSESNFWY